MTAVKYGLVCKNYIFALVNYHKNFFANGSKLILPYHLAYVYYLLLTLFTIVAIHIFSPRQFSSRELQPRSGAVLWHAPPT